MAETETKKARKPLELSVQVRVIPSENEPSPRWDRLESKFNSIGAAKKLIERNYEDVEWEVINIRDSGRLETKTVKVMT